MSIHLSAFISYDKSKSQTMTACEQSIVKPQSWSRIRCLVHHQTDIYEFIVATGVTYEKTVNYYIHIISHTVPYIGAGKLQKGEMEVSREDI